MRWEGGVTCVVESGSNKCDLFCTECEDHHAMEGIAKSLDFGGVVTYQEGEESDGASSSKGQRL